ncbi:MAG: hypothetical protein ACREFH_15380 [Stellaceae bacterium]
MIELDRPGLRVLGGIRERRIFEDDRGRGRARGDKKRLSAEAADKIGHPLTLFSGLDVTLIPGEAKGRGRNLDQEDVEFRIGRQAEDFDVHGLDSVERVYRHPAARFVHAALCPVRGI